MTQEDLALKPIYKPTPAFFLAVAAFASMAVPSQGSPVLSAASITIGMDQCESQSCGTFPGAPSYSGLLSGFPGTLTAGLGTSVTASGFPFPTLSDQAPASGANVQNAAEITYLLEVVPIGGGTTQSPVQIGVNAVGTTSATTVSNVYQPTGFPEENSASNTVQLELLAPGGDAVFLDSAVLAYTAGNSGTSTCTISNTSSAQGLGVVSTPGVGGASVGCASSYMFGGFTENGSYSILTNVVYEVAMLANITVGCSNDGLAHGAGSCAASASVDPIFTVPSGFQLVLSPGVGNGATAPEPGTWVMLAAGIGLMIAARLRHFTRSNGGGAPAR